MVSDARRSGLNDKKLKDIRLSRLVPYPLASLFLLIMVSFSVLLVVAVPYYLETETSVSKIGLVFEGVEVHFENDGTTQVPVKVDFILRVYNPSPNHMMVVNQFSIDYLGLNNQELRYVKNVFYPFQEIKSGANDTIILTQEGPNLQPHDVGLISNARQDDTWVWQLGNENARLRAWFVINYKKQEKWFQFSSQNTTVIDIPAFAG